jgi:hypothetical protein
MPTLADTTAREYPGVHNAVAFHEGFVSGAVPEGDAGFASLAAMGVRTIISVDGAVPDVAGAAAHGMRYIHLPIGYDGFDEQRRLQLARATRDAMDLGPVYIHCHHGKHRSAGAAASIAASLGWASPEHGVARMKVSGTAPNYTGLYACAANAREVSLAALEEIPADFPSVWAPTGTVQAMVEIDAAFEHLKLIQAAGWTTPPDHPDLVPVAEAGRLADLHRTLLDAQPGEEPPTAEYLAFMREGQGFAQRLEDLLLAEDRENAVLDEQMTLILNSCKECHAAYRN